MVLLKKSLRVNDFCQHLQYFGSKQGSVSSTFSPLTVRDDTTHKCVGARWKDASELCECLCMCVCVCVVKLMEHLRNKYHWKALLNKLMWRVTLHSVFTLLYLHYFFKCCIALHCTTPTDEICTLPEWQQKALLWSSVDTVIKKKNVLRGFLFFFLFFFTFFSAVWLYCPVGFCLA